jgi:hypothetical protein
MVTRILGQVGVPVAPGDDGPQRAGAALLEPCLGRPGAIAFRGGVSKTILHFGSLWIADQGSHGIRQLELTHEGARPPPHGFEKGRF